MLGSSWVRVPGTAGGPLLAIVGHIDEIALVATHAGDDGLIAVDVTHATDIRGGDPEDEGDNRLGGGAALMRGPSMHPRIFDLLFETAEAEGIPFTVEVSRGHTNTDADAVYLSRMGVATGLVSVPLRYMHTPVETVDLDDIEAAVRLLVAFARRLEPGLSLVR